MGLVRNVIDCLSRFWLWFFLCTTPILALGGGLGLQATAIFLGFCGLLTVLFIPETRKYFRVSWVLPLIMFLIWVWVSEIWSPYEDKDIIRNAPKFFIFGVFLMMLPAVFCRLSENSKILMTHALMASSVLAVGVLLLDRWSGHSITVFLDPVREGSNLEARQGQAEKEVGRGILTYIQFFWPIAFLMSLRVRHGWVLALGLFVMICMAATLTQVSLSIPTLLCSAVLAVIAWYRPRLGIGLAFGVAILSIVLAPLVGVFAQTISDADMATLPLSWEHRIRMWRYTLEQIKLMPIQGHGFDASRTFDETFLSRDGRDIPIISLHTHNVGLQIWLETGLIGVFLFTELLIGFWCLSLRLCNSAPRMAALAGLVTVTAIHGALTIGMWQYWWWGVIVLAACLIVFVTDEKRAVLEAEPAMPIIKP